MQPIKDYFLIGDFHTAALVSSYGSIDWLCMPHFDSPSFFAGVLDEERGGQWSVNTKGYTVTAKYLPETPIVETTFTGKDATFVIRDFMRPQPSEDVVPHFLVRKVRGIQGKSAVRFSLRPRPKYARQSVTFRRKNSLLFHARMGERSLWLHVPKESKVRRREHDSAIDITVHIKEGEERTLIMEYSFESKISIQRRDLEAETVDFWNMWVGKGKFFKDYRDQLVRSAITLKLMQFYPTGGIIAAPTTSLPEEMGGVRNWDYRYVWLRDATFTLYGLFVLGYTDEAKKFFHFIEEISEGFRECNDEQCDADIAIMYTIWGERIQREYTIPHLRGYERSTPVRVGNAASAQRQLDIYGSVIDAYYFMGKLGISISKKGREIILLLVRKIMTHWQEEESGIWEVRHELKHHTYGKLMAWVGIDRALRMADPLQISPETRARWETARKEIKEWIWEHCFDATHGTFVQFPGAGAQDATNFLFVLLQFLDRHDEQTKQVMRRTCEELCKEEMYMYRYRNPDGLPGGEGAFILCTYWYIAALAAVGEVAKAERLFTEFGKNLAPSGLIAEEIDPKAGAYLGNFPQAFSHIGLIMAAYYIERYRRSPPPRGEG